MTRYQRWTLRLPALTLLQITQIASAEGWQLSDFMRSLIVIGSAANWLGLEGEGHRAVLKMKAELDQLCNRVTNMRSIRRRRYAPRSSQDKSVIALILPRGVARLIESYAYLREVSKNDLCGNLLTEGLMVYLTGEKNLLQATVPADRMPEGSPDTET